MIMVKNELVTELKLFLQDNVGAQEFGSLSVTAVIAARESSAESAFCVNHVLNLGGFLRY